jgi:hypothetical protein
VGLPERDVGRSCDLEPGSGEQEERGEPADDRDEHAIGMSVSAPDRFVETQTVV